MAVKVEGGLEAGVKGGLGLVVDLGVGVTVGGGLEEEVDLGKEDLGEGVGLGAGVKAEEGLEGGVEGGLEEVMGLEVGERVEGVLEEVVGLGAGGRVEGEEVLGVARVVEEVMVVGGLVGMVVGWGVGARGAVAQVRVGWVEGVGVMREAHRSSWMRAPTTA